MRPLIFNVKEEIVLDPEKQRVKDGFCKYSIVTGEKEHVITTSSSIFALNVACNQLNALSYKNQKIMLINDYGTTNFGKICEDGCSES